METMTTIKFYKEFNVDYLISKRTLQKFFYYNSEILEKKGLIKINNKNGIRKQYIVINPSKLRKLILETYRPEKRWRL